jgi:hypothetical protein
VSEKDKVKAAMKRRLDAGEDPRASDMYELDPEWAPGKRAVGRATDWLTENVVDPLSNAGWPNLGAAVATVPGVAVDLVVPTHASDLMAMTPGPGKAGKKVVDLAERRAAKEATKAMERRVGKEAVTADAARSGDVIAAAKARGFDLELNSKGYWILSNKNGPLPRSDGWGSRNFDSVDSVQRFLDDVAEKTPKSTEKAPKGFVKIDDDIFTNEDAEHLYLKTALWPSMDDAARKEFVDNAMATAHALTKTQGEAAAAHWLAKVRGRSFGRDVSAAKVEAADDVGTNFLDAMTAAGKVDDLDAMLKVYKKAEDAGLSPNDLAHLQFKMGLLNNPPAKAYTGAVKSRKPSSDVERMTEAARVHDAAFKAGKKTTTDAAAEAFLAAARKNDWDEAIRIYVDSNKGIHPSVAEDMRQQLRAAGFASLRDEGDDVARKAFPKKLSSDKEKDFMAAFDAAGEAEDLKAMGKIYGLAENAGASPATLARMRFLMGLEDGPPVARKSYAETVSEINNANAKRGADAAAAPKNKKLSPDEMAARRREENARVLDAMRRYKGKPPVD